MNKFLLNNELTTDKKIVVIGGGTGSYTLLTQLKIWSKNITAVVNMCDDGGSSGKFRDEMGVLPPGDVRQCLVALSNNPSTRNLFSYRFDRGSLEGHPLGNIILFGLELKHKSFTRAIEIVSEFLELTGKVVPVSKENHTLVMVDGKRIVRGEHKITQHKIIHPGAKIYLEPRAIINPEAERAIHDADLIIIAPGNIYGSILPALIVSGMSTALRAASAPKIMVTNLVNKPKQTLNWHVVDYVKEVEKYIGKGVINYVLYNSKKPSRDLLNKYAEKDEYPVKITPTRFNEISAEAIGAPFVANRIFRKDPGDKAIRRTLIRHDAVEITKQLKKLSSI